MPPVIKKSQCVGCHKCVKICPMDVFGYQAPGIKIPVIQYPDECWHCNSCVIDCPTHAMSLRIPAPLSVVFVDAPEKKEG